MYSTIRYALIIYKEEVMKLTDWAGYLFDAGVHTHLALMAITIVIAAFGFGASGYAVDDFTRVTIAMASIRLFYTAVTCCLPFILYIVVMCTVGERLERTMDCREQLLFEFKVWIMAAIAMPVILWQLSPMTALSCALSSFVIFITCGIYAWARAYGAQSAFRGL